MLLNKLSSELTEYFIEEIKKEENVENINNFCYLLSYIYSCCYYSICNY